MSPLKPIPEKHCTICGSLLVIRDNELRASFMVRKVCSRDCRIRSANDTKRNTSGLRSRRLMTMNVTRQPRVLKSKEKSNRIIAALQRLGKLNKPEK